MWKSTVAGRTLHFRLAGINNQNFIMSDEETGTWWQQVSGLAILGPLKGQSLDPMPWDEVAFALFRAEHPDAGVLLPAGEYEADYESADWEKEVAELPTVGHADPEDPLQPRDLIVGVAMGTQARAYRWSDLDPKSPIADEVGGTPILILLHPDGRSLRCFDRRLDGGTLDLLLRPGSNPPVLVEGSTGGEWDFGGLATDGPFAGKRLGRVACLKDYWFDWKNYHPETGVHGIPLTE